MPIEAVVDNDVLLKAVSYELTKVFWPAAGISTQVCVLGAARYVVSSRIERSDLVKDRGVLQAILAEFIAANIELEPSEREVELATQLELIGQRENLPLDSGESQLAAMAIERGIPLLETGDKRAIASFERLLDHLGWLDALIGKVRGLEQIVVRVATEQASFAQIAEAICKEPSVDKTLSICFSCYSDNTAEQLAVMDALAQYVKALREDAPRILAEA